MNCLKCGQRTTEDRMFCEDCLQDMEKYPVKPGTVVYLPKRREAAPPKKVSKRRVLPPEEQIKLLRTRVKWLSIALAAAVVLILVMAYPSIQYMMEDHFELGQNYSVATTPTENDVPEIPD